MEIPPKSCRVGNHSAGLEGTVGLDQNPAQTLLGPNPCSWDLNQPKHTIFQLRSHAWFQDLMKLRHLDVSSQKGFKVVGKKH